MAGSLTTERRMARWARRGISRQRALEALLTGGLLFACFIAGLAYVQYGTPGLIDNDGYYHVKMAYLIRTHGLTPGFPYLPLTILNPAGYYDHHLLYHVYLALFAGVDPAVDGGLALTQGAKLAAVLMPALAFLAFWWLLRGQRAPLAPLWALGLLAVSEPFLYRMSMPRAQSMALLLLILGLHWMLQERYKLLLPLGFVFVWAYNGFPLLLVMSAVYVAATYLLTRRIAWPALAYPAAGIALGLLVNPYFPQNLQFIIGHLSPKLGGSETVVGNEWSPYRTLTLLENSAYALLAFVAGALALGWNERRIDRRTLVALGMAVLTGYMLFESRRFVEYFPAFALLFLAFAAAPLLERWAPEAGGKRMVVWLVAALLLVYPAASTLSDARALAADSKPADLYADAASWLRDNVEPGTLVFQTDWDDFTRLFFYDSRHVYTAGLDPTFMELHDPALFGTWVSITGGEVDQPGAVIRDRFGAGVVFSDLRHGDFLRQAERDPSLQEVFRNGDAVIFRVRE